MRVLVVLSVLRVVLWDPWDLVLPRRLDLWDLWDRSRPRRLALWVQYLPMVLRMVL